MSSEKTEKQLAKLDDALFVDDILKRAMETKIVTPEDYSVENAVKSAYLQIYEKGYFQECSQSSIMNAVMDMVVQGLNVSKDQGYFIKYGKVLKFHRSYMGSVAVTKRFDSRVENVYSEVIYEGDKVDYDIEKGMKRNIKHKQSFDNINKDNILGCYVIALDKDGNEIESDLMSWPEILKSWERSQKTNDQTKPVINGKINPNSDHGKHPARFCRRTLINRLCKNLISATDDKELLKAVRKTDENAPIIEVIQDEIDENANKKLIDFQEAKEIIEIKPEPENNMASKEQYQLIMKLSEQLNQKEKTMEEISGFFNRDVKKISELTFDEAAQYIVVLNEQIKELPDDAKPDWA